MSNLLGPRDENGIPVPMTVDESIASMKASLLKKIKRSAYVYRVDCGGCNGCEIEIFATLSPLFDAERFGIKVVPSPRHADILLFPDIQAGNLVYKTLVHTADCKNGCILTGTKVPAILTSRSDSFQTKVNSIALAAVVAAGLDQ